MTELSIEHNAMDKSSKKKSAVKKITQFEIIRPQVAGIDVSDIDGKSGLNINVRIKKKRHQKRIRFF